MRRRRSRWPMRLGAVLGFLLAVIIAAGLALDTAPGRRWLADWIAEQRLDNGLHIRIGRIDGSIYGRAVLRDVELLDTRRVVFEAPQVTLDWRPLAWIANTLDIRELDIVRGRVLALPKLDPSDPDAPLLPGFDIRIDKLRAEALVIDAAVSGTRRVADVRGKIDIRTGRALVDLVAALRDGSDQLTIKLDSVPEQNRLILDADLVAPADGVIAVMLGTKQDLTARLKGRGDWTLWQGKLEALYGGERLANLAIAALQGQVKLNGALRPALLFDGGLAQMLAPGLDLDAEGTLAKRVLSGKLALRGRSGTLTANGAIDLGNNEFDAVKVVASLTRPELLVPGLNAQGLRGNATLNGSFAALTADYVVLANRLGFGSAKTGNGGGAELVGLRATGLLQRTETGWSVPLNVTTTAIATGNGYADQVSKNLRLNGTVEIAQGRIGGKPLRLTGANLNAAVRFSSDRTPGQVIADADIQVPRLLIDKVGLASVSAKVKAAFGGKAGWSIIGDLTAVMVRTDNATVVNLIGAAPRASTQFRAGAGQPLVFTNAAVLGEHLALVGGGRLEADGRLIAFATGKQARFGPFDVRVDSGTRDGLATVLLSDPLPALGIRDAQLVVAGITDGFSVDVTAQSALGPISGLAAIYATASATRIEVERLRISETLAEGTLTLVEGGLDGILRLSGGGLGGFVRMAPRNGGQGINGTLDFAGARFDGIPPITVNQGTIEIDALFKGDTSTVKASLLAQGIGRGKLFLGKIKADAELVNGRGRVTASLEGRRGSRFDMQTAALIGASRISVNAQGRFANRRLRLVRPAVFSRLPQGGWQLAPATIRTGRGRIGVSGRLGSGLTEFKLQLSQLPMALAEIAYADLGFGGNASGLIEFRQRSGEAPTGRASIKLAQLSRAGVLFSSRPVDIAANAALSGDALSVRATLTEQGKTVGRLQALVDGLPAGFDTFDRLRRGRLSGSARFNGPLDALWRLSGVEVFDLSGTAALSAELSGSLRDPSIRGILATRDARLESALSGTLVEGIKANGRFQGAQLTLTRFSGRAGNGGTVSGSGKVDYGGLFDSPSRGVKLDFDIDANRALLVNRDDFGATMTGKLTIKSAGNGGVLGGDVRIDAGRFVLGRFNAAEQLPNIAFREINRQANEAPRRVRASPWTYAVTARAANRVAVSGLGLDSEWGTDIVLGGTIEEPRITGSAQLVRGTYEFAGREFDLERGRITFRGESPPNPALDIEARANLSDINATINVRGTGLRPEISFTSVPALPEDELLARLLFGASITDISAPEAVQLAAALASLQSGGGLDPINALRGAVGLDRLRIVAGDAQTGQGMSIAAGKYITRNTYVEIVTDGRGYSATQIEFQITRWLSILSSISTIGRQSVNVRVSKDY